MRRLISSGSPFEAGIGYSRAVADDEWIFVSGTTGFDYEAMTISADVREQAEQTMRNIGRALAEAGSSFVDVVSETLGADMPTARPRSLIGSRALASSVARIFASTTSRAEATNRRYSSAQ
jgi:enamine deaminase RidA (YjgF/YER057c/UK114 family)